MSLENPVVWLSHMNCSEYDTWLPPSAKEFLGALDGTYLTLLILAILATTAVIVVGILHWYFVRYFVSSRSKRTSLFWFIGLFPAASICCLMGLFMPRTSTFMFAVAWIYLTVCLLILIRVMQQLFGGRGAMSKYLFDNHQKISFRVPPCCCCLKFLPEAEPTESNLRKLEFLVLQTLVVRVILTIISITAVLELHQDAERLISIVSIIAGISTVSALFGCHTLATLAKEKLAPYRFVALFRILDFTLALFGLQQLICDILINFDVYSCGPLLSPQDKSRYWNGFLLIFEMLALSGLASYLFKPTKTAIFDRHPCQIVTDRSVPETLYQL
uniref:Uncharacterized protein n=1 Tax=Plectus sambesii TaxID=2011161 RepID=A0A914WHY4_9BILA